MDKLGQLSLDKLSLDRVKNMVGEVRDTIAPRNETDKRVYEALSNKNWGASSTLLNDIARDTYDFEKYGIVLPLIWNALQCPSREWRKVFKALSLLEHLIKNGAERVIEDARDNLHRVRMLSDFNYYEGPVDKGSGVREKSKQLIDLLKDNEMIREEREKSRKLRDKYVGLGSSGGGFGGGGYGYSSGGGGGGGYSGGGGGYSGGGGGYSAGGGGYSGGGGSYGGDRPSRYGDSSYSGGGGYSDRGGGGGYNNSVEKEGFSSKGGYSDTPEEDKEKPGEGDKEHETSSKSKRERKKSSGSKLAIKIKDKSSSAAKSSSAEPVAAAAAPPAPVPDLLGGDLLTIAPASASASAPAAAGSLGDFFSSPSAAPSTNGGLGLDSFDPRARGSTALPSVPGAGVPAVTAAAGGFEQEFAGFLATATPPAAATGASASATTAFSGTGGTMAFGHAADLFSATPAPVLSGGLSGVSLLGANQGMGAMAPTAAATVPPPSSNGVDEFSDFQGASGDKLVSGVTNGGAGSAAGGGGGITNPKWRDVSSLVDLGGLSSNMDKKAAIQKQEEQTFQSNNNSFAGLDGFQSRPQGIGAARPPATGSTGLSGRVHAGGMMGVATGFQHQQHTQQYHQPVQAGWMGAQYGMGASMGQHIQPQQQQQQPFGGQGMGMGMGMGMQQAGGAMMGNKRGLQAGGAAAGAGGTVMPGGLTGPGASGGFF